jgi:hypothetical protein
MTGSGLPTFTYPVNSGTNQTRYFNGVISAQTISVYYDNLSINADTSLALFVNGVQVDCQIVPTIPNPDSYVTLTLPKTVISPASISVSMIDGHCSYIPSDLPIAQSAMSYSGQYAIVAAGSFSSPYADGFIYVSNNYGAFTSWQVKGSLYDSWSTVSISGNGQYMIAGSYNVGGKVYKSTNYGVTWTEITNLPWDTYYTGHGVFTGSAISNTGQYQWLTTGLNSRSNCVSQLFRSTDYGATWSLITRSPYVAITSIAISSNAQYVSYSVYGGGFGAGNGSVFYSSNGTASTPIFNASQANQSSNFNVTSVSMSTSGQQQAVAFSYGSYGTQFAYAVSNDYGATFTINATQYPQNYIRWQKVFVASSPTPEPAYGYRNIYGVPRVGQSNFLYSLDDPGEGGWGLIGISISGTSWFRQMTTVAFSSDHSYMLLGSTKGLARRVGQQSTGTWEAL